MYKSIVFFLLISVIFYSGCGIVSLMGTPGNEEIMLPAEYSLAEQKNKKILVLVNQPGWLNVQENVRYYLTEAVNKRLTEKVGIIPENLIGYSRLAKFRSNRPDLQKGPAVEIGEALGVDMVLVIDISNCWLRRMAEIDYYSGALSANVSLVDVASERKIWPRVEDAKAISVGFDVEEGGQEVAVERLSAACAHCIIRYLYNCKKVKFKIIEDKSGSAWEEWGS